MDIQTSHQLLAKIAQVKSAEPQISDLRSTLSPQAVANLESGAKQDAIKNILQVGLIAGGGAVGVRSAQGLWNLLTRANTPAGSRVGVSPLPVPYPTDEAEEEEQGIQLKAAQDNPVKLNPNDYARWYWPGMVAAAMGGGYGGWKLSDAIFDERRKEEAEDELESAKEDFQEALTSHYDVPEAKVAAEKTAASKLGDELDSLFVRFEKSAGDGIIEAMGTVAKLPGQAVDTLTSPGFKEKALGAYGAYAVPSVLLGYLAAKHISDKNSERKVLEKAMRRRAAKNYAKRPSELYAIPDPQLAGREEDRE
jgi:hypothetical protein|tara:strand:+ start:2290 stop:3213 length:924 start_codon:yes stop_codon:yes gene_type:complete